MSSGAGWLWLSVLCAASGAARAVVGGAPAAPPEPDAAVVFVQRNSLSARLEGTRDDKIGYYSFLGIRYAEPPVGQRRFQRPVRRLLAGEVAARRACQPCPQQDPRRPGQLLGHEDCLCLSIYTPKMPGSEEGSPVIIFIHGGNYQTGSANAYGGQHLVQQDTILVTLQYRLGSLGFLSTGQKDAGGNVGLFDMQAAYSWVTDYIKFFGGDPSRIVVMGQGSGGSAASLLALSPQGRAARGLVALSGAPLSPGAVRPDPLRQARELARRTGCPAEPAEQLVACLRSLPVEKIIMADSQLDTEDMVDTQAFLNDISGRSGAGARVEGAEDERGLPPLVLDRPARSLADKQQRCPMLTGVTSAETSRAVYGKYSSFLGDKLKQVKDFVKNELVGGLRSVVQGVEGLVPLKAVQSAIPILLADYYQTILDSSVDSANGLLQIAEATADALFNLPAYKSVEAWSSEAPAYLYSFEHLGNLSRGSHFLPGVALTDDSNEVHKASGPAHGDDLAYIFEPLDASGSPLAGDVSSTDKRVRDAFVGLIAKFAHNLQPIEQKNNSKITSFKPFSDKNGGQYLKIKDEITVDENFRFCQIGLWGGMADRVTGSFCKDVLGNLLKVPKMPVNLPVKPKLPMPDVPEVSLVPKLPGLGLSGQGQQNPKQPKVTMRPLISPFRF